MEGREPEAVVSWLYEDGLEPELIKFAYRYCTEKRGQNRFSYVSAVVREWIKAGIFKLSDAEKYLDDTELRRNQYKRIMQALGFYRNPTEAEQAMICLLYTSVERCYLYVSVFKLIVCELIEFDPGKIVYIFFRPVFFLREQLLEALVAPQEDV